MSALARRWVTLNQAAEHTGRSRRTIERWIADQRLPAAAVGGVRYVALQQLLEVERATRRAARAGRPGASLPSGVVTFGHSGLRPAPEPPR